MMKYGVDDRSNGVPESECLFVVVDAGEECIDVFPARAEAVACIERDRAKEHPYIRGPVLLVVPRWGRTIEREALAADGSRYTAVFWPDGQPSEVWADDEHHAAEHGYKRREQPMNTRSANTCARQHRLAATAAAAEHGMEGFLPDDWEDVWGKASTITPAAVVAELALPPYRAEDNSVRARGAAILKAKSAALATAARCVYEAQPDHPGIDFDAWESEAASVVYMHLWDEWELHSRA